MVSEISQFFIFQDGGCRHLEFKKFSNFISVGVQRVQMLYKYCQNLPIHCGVIAIFRFFKIVAATILDFRNSEILLADGVRTAEMHHRVKFHENPLIRCRVIQILIFQDGGHCYLRFQKFSNFIS